MTHIKCYDKKKPRYYKMQKPGRRKPAKPWAILKMRRRRESCSTDNRKGVLLARHQPYARQQLIVFGADIFESCCTEWFWISATPSPTRQGFRPQAKQSSSTHPRCLRPT